MTSYIELFFAIPMPLVDVSSTVISAPEFIKA